MIFNKGARVALATQLLIVISSIVGAETRSIHAELIEELHRWIDTTTALPAASATAAIEFAVAQELAEPSEMESMIGSTLRGLYDPDTRTITLVHPWSAENPQDVAVLLHELVHHRQGGKHFYCEAAKEYPAYKVQKEWLAERDLTLDVNWIAIVLVSSCPTRDFHP